MCVQKCTNDIIQEVAVTAEPVITDFRGFPVVFHSVLESKFSFSKGYTSTAKCSVPSVEVGMRAISVGYMLTEFL